MALTTAISFVLDRRRAGLILAVRPAAYAIFGIINSVPLSLALTSLIGYAFQITYVLPFSLGSQMALHTAAGVPRLRHRDARLRLEACRARGGRTAERGASGIGVALLPVLLVGASALFPGTVVARRAARGVALDRRGRR